MFQVLMYGPQVWLPSTSIPRAKLGEQVNLRLLSLQQAPVGCDLHLQVLLDAQQVVVVGLGALHVQPQLGQVVLHLAQGGLQLLHLARVFLTRLRQVALQRGYLRRRGEDRLPPGFSPKPQTCFPKLELHLQPVSWATET